MLLREQACMDVAHGHGIFAALNSLLVFPDDETSLLRINPFAGKRCIVDRLPLPSCCDNPYCVAHLSKPSHDGHTVTAKDNLRKAALKIAFARHDKNSSGEGLYGKPQPLAPQPSSVLLKSHIEFRSHWIRQRKREGWNYYDPSAPGTYGK